MPTPPATIRTSGPWFARSGRTSTTPSPGRRGADPAAIHAWFAEGMLLNVAASLGNLDDAIDLKLDLGGAFAWH